MAISVMKRLLVISKHSNQSHLLETLQSLKEVEVSSLDAWIEGREELFASGAQTSNNVDLNLKIRNIKDALEILDEYIEQPSLFKRIRMPREVYTLQELEASVNEVDIDALIQKLKAEQERIEVIDRELVVLSESEDFLRQWQKLNFSPERRTLAYFYMVMGEIDSEKVEALYESLEDLTVYRNEIYSDENTSGFIFVTGKNNQATLESVLRQHDFVPLVYPYEIPPSEALVEKLAKREGLLKERSELTDRLKANQEAYKQLMLAEEFYINLLERGKARDLIQESEHLFILHGWVPEAELSEVLETLNQEFPKGSLATLTYDVDEAQDDLGEVPVKLVNNRFNQAFENLTLQFGIPRYDSIDPTPFYALFQILFFGLMSADVGYGLLLFLGTLIPLLFFELKDSQRNQLLMFNLNSIGTMLVGLFFGSFFGFTLPFQVMDVTQGVIQVMVFSVAIGVVHMIVGYCLKLYLDAKRKDWSSMYLNALQWILMLVGAILLAINMVVGMDILNKIGLFLILGNIAGMFIVNMISANNPLVGFGLGLFGLIDVAGMVGDVVSYTRLTALGVAGANIGMAFNIITGLFPPLARFTLGLLVFVALHALNIFITFLGAYVHSMRLQFVEFFGKFYETGGKAFEPLKPREEHIIIEHNHRSKK